MAKTDFIYTEVTNKVIEELEKGSIKWLKSWKGGLPINMVSKNQYKGINALLLNLVMQQKGYTNSSFLTFNQAKAKGGYIRKGEKATMIIFWKLFEIEQEVKKNGIKTGETENKRIPLLRYHKVFNIEQTEGIKYEKKVGNLDFKPIEKAEEIVKGYKDSPKIEHKGTQPCYNFTNDIVMIPKKESFTGVEEYYSTVFHELSHSTGHKTRLDRGLKARTMKSTEYAKEEIIVELSTAFLTAHAGIENKTLQNNSAYIKSWLSQLKEDKKFIFKISKDAQKSCDYIIGGDKDGI